MPTRSAPSRRPAISSITRPPNACMTTSIRPAARAIRKRTMWRSVGGSRKRTRCCGGGAFRKRRRRPEMGILVRRLIGVVLLAAALATGVLLIGPRAAQAHPHVWITAASELLYAPDGAITGVRHAWTFDDMFSTYALQGLETKTQGVYSHDDLAPLAQTNVESLKEFGFFTFAKADGKKEKFEEPVDYFLDYNDTLLTLHFTLPLKTPVKAKVLALEVFDPEF